MLNISFHLYRNTYLTRDNHSHLTTIFQDNLDNLVPESGLYRR